MPILIAEDESKVAQLMIDYLQTEGFTTIWVTQGSNVVETVKQEQPDVVILDIMLPGKDGLSICKELRTWTQVPIIMVTARVEEIDRLLGLELGADDYLCKPFSPRELVARVKALLRRSQHATPAMEEPTQKVIHIDFLRHEATFHQQALELTPVEFRLLKTLAEYPERVFSREQLLNQLYADHRVVTDRTVDTHIKNLRRKMEQTGHLQPTIRTIYGVGYKLTHHEDHE